MSEENTTQDEQTTAAETKGAETKSNEPSVKDLMAMVQDLSGQLEAIKGKNQELIEEKRKVKEKAETERQSKMTELEKLQEQMRQIREENEARKREERMAKKSAAVTKIVRGNVLSEALAEEFLLNRADFDDEGQIVFNFNGSNVRQAEALDKFFELVPEMKPSEQRAGAGTRPTAPSRSSLQEQYAKARKDGNVGLQISLKREAAAQGITLGL